VDLVLTGHEHMYARTKQLALQPGCTAISPDAYNPSCVVDSDADLVRGAGTVFDTVGTGGVQTVPVDTTAPDFPYFAETNGTGNATYGVLEVTVTASSLSAGFQRASGGTFGDSFAINADPSVPSPTVVASDDFARTLASGGGAADQGGSWTVKGSASATSVAGGRGLVRMAAGAGTGLFLPAVDSADTDVQLTLSLDKVPTGGSTGSGQSVWVRRVATAGDYRATVRLAPSGTVRLGLYSANTSGMQTALTAEVPVPGLTNAAVARLAVRAQATGTSPTTVRAKVWKRGDPEPSGWLVSTTDATPGLQQSGSVGVQSYLTGTATNAPISAAFDDLRVYRASTLP
jgi:hypothetical protein